MSVKRDVPLGVMLSVVSGRLMCDMSVLHEHVEWLAGHAVWTHQIPRVLDELKPQALRLFPQLAVDLSDVTAANIETRMRQLEFKLGTTTVVSQDDFAAREVNPTVELLEKVGKGSRIVEVYLSKRGKGDAHG